MLRLSERGHFKIRAAFKPKFLGTFTLNVKRMVFNVEGECVCAGAEVVGCVCRGGAR